MHVLRVRVLLSVRVHLCYITNYLIATGESKKKKTKSLLPLSSSQNHKQKAASQKECVLLAKYLQGNQSITILSNFSLSFCIYDLTISVV